jgi:neural Wiskott-Aldrich syndrome protein
MDNLDPDLKAVFDKLGLSEQQLRDKETAQFIYNFIEEHGGLEAVKEETRQQQQQQRPTGPRATIAPPPPPPAFAPATHYPPTNTAQGGK